MRKLLPVLLMCLVLLPAANAQRNQYRPVRGKVFPDLARFKQTGFYFSPGATYMAAPTWRKKLVSRVEGEDEIVEGYSRPFGSPGIFLGVGRYHILERWIYFEYLDYGLAYKSLRGTESYESIVLQKPDETQVSSVRSAGRFGDHFLSGHFNLHHVANLSSTKMIQNTIGINLDYGFLRNRLPGSPEQLIGGGPPAFLAQLHYKIGYGFKASSKLLIIPSIETPILNVVQWEKGKSSLGYFTSRYRPLIFSLRFLLFRKQDGESCPPVFNPANPEELQQKLDKKREKQYK